MGDEAIRWVETAFHKLNDPLIGMFFFIGKVLDPVRDDANQFDLMIPNGNQIQVRHGEEMRANQDNLALCLDPAQTIIERTRIADTVINDIEPPPQYLYIGAEKFSA
jgi:hypothetical protein